MKLSSAVRLPASMVFLLTAVQAAVVVDASRPPSPAEPLPFEAGGRSPDGRVLSINSRYLTLDGKPWFPMMGEFQYSRYPAADWEREILKMKAGGIRIISTYIFWIHHEEIEGHFDWSGQRDLRRFVEIAGRHGMFVWARIGPWDHGEVRNGGLPDWALQQSRTRSNDPAYLRYVARFYNEIGGQLKGLFWKDGGPIVGVQIENEYHERGKDQGEQHILTLRSLAREAGLVSPFYSVTGWDNAAMPSRDVIPVFGGYPDGFWYRSREPLPPSPNYFFTAIRCEENVDGALCSKRPDLDARFANYPYFTAEMGGGMAIAYHRRPVMSADDIAALDVVKLGSGVTLYGYYMFHGGTNPDGKATTLQESLATGYPNDLPQKAYDFQAPLGEFGQMHASFRDLKSMHLFLQDFGPTLAPMAPYLPKQMPSGKMDRETPRVGVRSDAKSGFVFINNYQKDWPLPEHRDFQVQVQLAGGTVRVPRQPATLPTGAYTFWPVNLEVGGAMLESATAQPLCKLSDPDTVVFFAWTGIAPEFVFQASEGVSVDAPGAQVKRESGRIAIGGLPTGLAPAIKIHAGGRTTQILLLSRDQARNLWKAPLAGRDRLIFSAADVYFEGDRVHLASADPAALAFGVYPKLERKPEGFQPLTAEGLFERYAARVEPVALEPAVKQLAQPGRVGPVRISQEVAQAPEETEFAAAGRWSVHVPNVKSSAVDEVFLRITYEGDVARIYASGHMITDDFYRGTPWEIGLRNIPAAALRQGLELKILPLRQDAPIYLAAGARPSSFTDGQAVRLRSVQIVPNYRAEADLGR